MYKTRMRLALLIIGFATLVSCNSEKNVIDISNFYYKLSDFETPKVFQFKVVDEGKQMFTYSKQVKLNDTDLLIEQYNDSLNLIYKAIYAFCADGIKYKDVWLPNKRNNGNLDKMDIIDSLVFSFDLKKSSFENKKVVNLPEDVKLTEIITHSLSIPRDTLINGHRTRVLYSNVIRKQILAFTKLPLISKEKVSKDRVVYVENKGLICTISEKENGGICTREFTKIISVEEFENLYNAR